MCIFPSALRLLTVPQKNDDFFSKEVTHLITFEAEEMPGNKENSRSRGTRDDGLLGSPIRLKTRFDMLRSTATR